MQMFQPIGSVAELPLCDLDMLFYVQGLFVQVKFSVNK